MKIAFAVLLLAGLLSVPTIAADPVIVTGRVVDEAGIGISQATIHVRNASLVTSDDGLFTFELDSPTTVSARVEAAGYFSFIQTLHRSDFIPGQKAAMPAIELVQKRAGRSLLMFAGDSMLSRRYFEPRAGEPALVRPQSILEDGKRLLQHVKPYIELADYASVNLETQLSSTEPQNRLPKSVTFYSPVELAELLQWAGFDYAALGNNHMFDYRDEGLTSTFDALADTSLDYSGAGFDDAEARRPARVDIDGQTHSFLSYVGWPGTFEPSQVAEPSKGGAAFGSTEVFAEDLGALSEESVAVLQLHSGLEYAAMPALSERTMLRQVIGDGADIAIGHHPHVLQGFEIVNDRLIAYSLGNFLFDQYHYTTQLGMLLYVWMDGDRLFRAEAVPLHINGYLPTPATGLFRHAVLARLARLSDASVCLHSSGFHAVVEPCDGKPAAISNVVVPDSAHAAPMHVRNFGGSPLMPISVDSGGRSYRLGLDLLARGDFEYARLHGAHDRSWIESANASLKTGNNNRLEIRVPAGGAPVRSGMKVFERVFTLSNPATISGRIKVEGDVKIRFRLQRRRPTENLVDALANGPITEIGVWEGVTTDWHDFSFDYNQPRIATTSVRLLIDVMDMSDEKSGATVSLDDLAWVEWQTPWQHAGDEYRLPQFATHIQLQVKP